MENITTTSAYDLVEKIKKGEISSVEVCEAYLERIKKFDKDVKAWAFFDKKLLIEKAKEKDESRKSGNPLGALQQFLNGSKEIIPLPVGVNQIFASSTPPGLASVNVRGD